jgi:hypothetical protein
LNNSPAKVGEIAGAGRGHVDLARVGFGISNELADGLCRKRRRDHHDEWISADARDRHDVLGEIEFQALIKRGVDDVRCAHEQERVTIARRAHHGFGRDVAAGAGAVFDDEASVEALRQPLRKKSRHHIGRAAGVEAEDDTRWPRRIIKCKGAAHRKASGARRKIKEFPAMMLHGVSPALPSNQSYAH